MMLRSLSAYLDRRRVRILKPFARNLPPSTLRLSLCDANPAMADAWIDTFRDVDAAEILHGDLFALSADALVSPANSVRHPHLAP